MVFHSYLFDSAKFTTWFTAFVDPSNHVEWVERWAARGHEIEHFPTWADRVTKGIHDAAYGQRYTVRMDAAQIMWNWVVFNPSVVHAWGCPDEGCGAGDKPYSSGKMINPLRRVVRDEIRKVNGDKKIMVDGKQVRLANMNLEVPLSYLAVNGETIAETADAVASYQNDSLKTIVRSDRHREERLNAGRL
ncbi:hypothetical protein [Jiangella gansuensis]|uniref:hypothetical protein n=1 Tax=Jiangella gansuensis TaxID=281473 RepID=UPI00047D5A93|nr:hypothetical protein [Jiangella gansuensis]